MALGPGAPAPRNFDFVFRELFTAALGVLGIYVSARIMKRVLDPNADAREQQRHKRQIILEKLCALGVPQASLYSMSAAEEALLSDIVFPDDIKQTFEEIGGLGGVKESVRELIVYPLSYPEIFNQNDGLGSSGNKNEMLAPPKGVLLYGPPGTGKTMLAKGLAKESGAIFLSLSPSSLLSKWLGETEQIARAVFTLASRIQPAVIFIDEIDGLFKERSSSEHEAHKNLKAEFMQLWDGLTTDGRNQVIVLGATNRPYDVDSAILRRMPRAFEVGLPTLQERVDILQTILRDTTKEVGFEYRKIAEVTDGYSGSDLKELCRAAMMAPAREAMLKIRRARAEIRQGGGVKGLAMSGNSQGPVNQIRALTVKDILHARKQVSRTEEQSATYLNRQSAAGPSGMANSEDSMQAMAAMAEPIVRMLQQTSIRRAV